jgi:hypothetical protein
MDSYDEKRGELRYKSNSSIIFQIFNSVEYHNAEEFNHSGRGISFVNSHYLKSGTVVYIRRVKGQENCSRGISCECCRTTTLATVRWCQKNEDSSESSYSVGAKYFEYGVGY